MSDDGDEVVIPESIAELEQLTGQKITDLHRERYCNDQKLSFYNTLKQPFDSLPVAAMPHSRGVAGQLPLRGFL